MGRLPTRASPWRILPSPSGGTRRILERGVRPLGRRRSPCPTPRPSSSSKTTPPPPAPTPSSSGTGRGFRVLTALTLAGALAFCGTPGLALALVDLGLPDGEGHDLVRRLARCDPPVPSVVITNRDDRRSLMAAVHAGTRGYVLKDEDPAFVLQVVDEALRGEVPLSGRMAGPSWSWYAPSSPSPRRCP